MSERTLRPSGSAILIGTLLCLLIVVACRQGVPVIDTAPKPAHPNGTISGIVSGPEGTSPIVGRVVQVINVDTGERQQETTSSTGGFTFKLKPGKYRVELTLREGESIVKQPGVIDFFAHVRKGDEVLMVMFEPRPWEDSDLQLFQLQEKFNAYVSFLLDGEMAEAHPELAGKNARIELRCAEMPEGRTLDLLNAIHDQLALQEIRVEVIVGNAGCGAGCTCH